MDKKIDYFIKPGDRKDVVEFVKEVEKFPCLYNKTLPEYANKVYNRRAWATIAKKANTTVPDCRDKWRKIRISFMRSLKQQQSDKPPMRPYYLTEELKFLLPFLKIRPQSISREASERREIPSPPGKAETMEFEIAPMTKHEISDSESDTFDNESNEQEISRVTFNDNTIPNIMKGSIENGHHAKQNVRNSYSDDIEGNPRKMFLLSMLPDIESLTEPEMRIFRREVINLVDNLINSRGNSI